MNRHGFSLSQLYDLRFIFSAGFIIVAPAMRVSHRKHRTEDIVPGFRLMHDRIGKHTTVPAYV